MGMPRTPRTSPAALLALILFPLAGCTLFPEKKQPTLATTTSAEATQRIFWNDVAAGKWNEANTLIAPDAVWRVGDRVLDHTEALAWLKSLGIHGAAVGSTQIKSAVNDMMLVYTLQLESQPAFLPCAARQAAGANPQTSTPAGTQTLSALAIWQQPQPVDDPKGKQKEKQSRGYLLTVLDLAPQAQPMTGAHLPSSCGQRTQ